MNKRGLTLVEILTVIIIIGVLSSLAYVNYSASRERVFDKEAVANLKVIQMAEKDYNLDYSPFYYPNTGSESDIPTINDALKLALPSYSGRNWNYTVYNNGAVCATRNVVVNQRYFLICRDDETAVRRDMCSPAMYCP